MWMKPPAFGPGHPEACQTLARLAITDGVQVERGVSDVTVIAGRAPIVTARGHDDATLRFTPDLVIGADGRGSTVRRQVGIQLDRHDATHMIAGLLVDGLDDVEIDHDFIATTDDLFMATTERFERMRRLRAAAMFQAAAFADDCANRPARRGKFIDLMKNEPLMMGMLGGLFAGPENAPEEAFDGHLRDLVVAA